MNAHAGGMAQIQLPPKLVPVFLGEADVRGAYGGRGSGKTVSFAKMTAVRGYMWGMAGREGNILGARQFMNSLDDSSLEEIKAAIKSEPWLEAYYEIGEKYVRSRDGRISYKFTGLDRNLNSIKSKARLLICWVDEAETVSDKAWEKLIPTLREKDSELWVTWNPESEKSATHKRFRAVSDPNMKVVEINWRDNPWFRDNEKLVRKRLADKRDRPNRYSHIWEGDFDKNSETLIFKTTVGRPEIPRSVAPRYGLDFGFGAHPCAVVKVYVIEEAKTIYIAKEAYGHVSLADLPVLIDSVIESRDDLIKADHADPGAIGHLCSAHRLRVRAAVKGQHSVRTGINWLQGYSIVIDPDCPKMQEEAESYRWQIDRISKEILAHPVDDWNHLWDAVRYATEDCQLVPLEGDPNGGVIRPRKR